MAEAIQWSVAIAIEFSPQAVAIVSSGAPRSTIGPCADFNGGNLGLGCSVVHFAQLLSRMPSVTDENHRDEDHKPRNWNGGCEQSSTRPLKPKK
jgi:hypothetical protein